MPQSPPLPGGKGSIWVWLSSPWACSTGHRLSVFPRVEHVNTKQASMSGAQGRKPETRDLEMIAGRLLSPSPCAAEPSPHCCPNLPQKTFLSASDSDSFSASVTLRLQLALPFLPEDVSKKKKKRQSKVARSCQILCHPSLPASSIHGIFQARIPGWVWRRIDSGIEPSAVMAIACLTFRNRSSFLHQFLENSHPAQTPGQGFRHWVQNHSVSTPMSP